MDRMRVAREGAFIIDDRPVAPTLVCGACGSDDLADATASVAGGVALIRVVCAHCGMNYYAVGTVADGTDRMSASPEKAGTDQDAEQGRHVGLPLRGDG